MREREEGRKEGVGQGNEENVIAHKDKREFFKKERLVMEVDSTSGIKTSS